ncbi:MAG TPA: TIGR01459 family HAD-type hydrolase [Alphaproteobacteria bacterium]|nr:TIGR01459 family HAD-type hydrolase [Alphaproteobacteria bacterium]
MTSPESHSKSIMPRPPTIPFYPGIAPLAGRYDGFVLDLWGVIHDGIKPYPAVADTLGRLKGMGKRVILLSNAPRRAREIADAMARKMALGPELYDELISSGEAAYWALRKREEPFFASLGRACYLMGPERDHGMLDGLDLDRVERMEAAEFILATGVDWDDDKLDIYEPALEIAAAKHLPMICANPDLEVIRGGKRVLCAGSLAKRYEALGGAVRYFGKPYAPIYELCFRHMGISERARIVAIGDSLRTDIAGAEAAGIAAVLVTGGIHAEELGIAHGEHPDPQALAEACARAGHLPIAAIPAFVW